MENLPISADIRRLSSDEIEQFNLWEYLQGLPVFDEAAVPQLQKRLQELEALMPVDVPISSVPIFFSGAAVSLSNTQARAILCPGIKIRSTGL